MLLGGVALLTSTAAAQTTDVPIHDPVMAEEDGTYYLFGTGEGITIWSSTDLEAWEQEPSIFDSAPEWTEEVVPDFDNVMWAPDVYSHNGRHYVYYSVSQFGRNSSAIGVVTNETLDPDSSDYEWTDHGIVVRSVQGRDMWNAIDPNLAFDDEGTPWLTFGSHWLGIKVVEMSDNLTETAPGAEWHTLATRHRYWKLHERDAGDAANPELNYDSLYTEEIVELNRDSESGAVEAPFIFQHGDYYYLFLSWDRCCRGTESTYKIVVGRSKDITGPYVDKEGEPLVRGGGSLVVHGLEDSERWAAYGHQAAYTFNGTDYLVFHAYDREDDGNAKLVMKEIQWRNGWPVASLNE
jgi:arabinan endo-1,5-alpha-L-arabinosidase